MRPRREPARTPKIGGRYLLPDGRLMQITRISRHPDGLLVVTWAPAAVRQPERQAA